MKYEVTLNVTSPEICIKEICEFIESDVDLGHLNVEHVETIVKLLTEVVSRKKEELSGK